MQVLRITEGMKMVGYGEPGEWNMMRWERKSFFIITFCVLRLVYAIYDGRAE